MEVRRIHKKGWLGWDGEESSHPIKPKVTFFIAAEAEEVEKHFYDKLSSSDRLSFITVSRHGELDKWFLGESHPIHDDDRFRLIVSQDLSRVSLSHRVFLYTAMNSDKHNWLPYSAIINDPKELMELQIEN